MKINENVIQWWKLISHYNSETQNIFNPYSFYVLLFCLSSYHSKADASILVHLFLFWVTFWRNACKIWTWFDKGTNITFLCENITFLCSSKNIWTDMTFVLSTRSPTADNSYFVFLFNFNNHVLAVLISLYLFSLYTKKNSFLVQIFYFTMLFLIFLVIGSRV